MDRNYRLKFCEQCTKRNFNPQKGLVCSITNEYATFDRSCADFNEDPIAKAAIEREKQQQEYVQQADGSLGLSKYGIKNGFAIAAVCFFGGLIWIIGGLIAIDRIFFYPFFLIGFGIYKFIATLLAMNKQKAMTKVNKDMLDDDVKW